jgi:hypothetical protein
MNIGQLSLFIFLLRPQSYSTVSWPANNAYALNGYFLRLKRVRPAGYKSTEAFSGFYIVWRITLKAYFGDDESKFISRIIHALPVTD